MVLAQSHPNPPHKLALSLQQHQLLGGQNIVLGCRQSLATHTFYFAVLTRFANHLITKYSIVQPVIMPKKKALL